MPFSPNLTIEQRNLLFAQMTSESRVNGFWNAVLAQAAYFPIDELNQPNYLVSPEERINAASRLDLQPARQVNLIPIAVYEGKGSTAGDTWEAIRRQLYDYGQAITNQTPNLPGVYLMGAKGQDARFWFYKKVQGGRIIVKDSSQLPPLYNVGTGFPEIDGILRFIRANPNPPVTP
ncbi:hypothetical protein B0J17DRAFT_685533 [Rhizoctonia solani]|nr:hypothetical protein B0J17DRAFT_685533 [Rhizoctonia solani]